MLAPAVLAQRDGHQRGSYPATQEGGGCRLLRGRFGHGGRRPIRRCPAGRSPRSTSTASDSRPWSRSSVVETPVDLTFLQVQKVWDRHTATTHRPGHIDPILTSCGSRRRQPRRRIQPECLLEEASRPSQVALNAASATPAPPVGTALGPHGVNIMEFVKGAANAATYRCLRHRDPG